MASVNGAETVGGSSLDSSNAPNLQLVTQLGPDGKPLRAAFARRLAHQLNLADKYRTKRRVAQAEVAQFEKAKLAATLAGEDFFLAETLC